MARFKINELNYMTSGRYETFVNLDMREHEPISSKSLLRSEHQEKVVCTENGISCMRVSDYSSHPDVKQEISRRVMNADRRNKTFVLERLLQNIRDYDYGNFQHGQRIVYPAFDMQDVSVKSRRRDGISVYGFTDEYANIYAPDISSDPVGFCRYFDDCCVLTEYSDQRAKTLRIDIDVHPGLFYGWQVRKFDDGQFLYGDPLRISGNAVKFGVTSAACIAFSPVREIQQISGNYMLIMNQSEGDNNYSAGDVYGDAYETKKTFDNSYSMNMTDANGMNGCRRYTGVFQCGGKTYLKFDDGIRYEFKNNTVIKKNDFGYQKVEEFSAKNASIPAKHKSNIYSVILNNTSLTPSVEDTQDMQRIKQYLRLDITNAIREIAENVCPANTQLLDVIYES